MQSSHLPKHFFDLTHEECRILFDHNLPVWDALAQLKERIQAFPLGMIQSDVHPLSVIENRESVYIAKGVTVGPHVVIEGPVVILEGARIAPGAYLRPYSVIGQGAYVGHCTEVKHSILLSCARTPHFNYVGDSILGREVNIGSSVVCANYRLDGGIILVGKKGARIPTGLNKLGAIIGDKASIGCTTHINPGTLIAANAHIGPNETLIGEIDAHTA
ncbi:MAG: Bifunctional protein GlmU [Chlamydiia bacterium]|nr:Bifunctional protein GlmU [Chlamydiia bacterium]